VGTNRLVSLTSQGRQADGRSSDPSIDVSGRRVAFLSEAGNLVPGDRNEVADVFVRDLRAGTTRLVSVDRRGGPANGVSETPAISRNGRYVVFVSAASDLVAGDTNKVADVFVRDLRRGRTSRISGGVEGQADGVSESPSISADGRYVTFVSEAGNLTTDDTNGSWDGFLVDRQTGVTTRLRPDCTNPGVTVDDEGQNYGAHSAAVSPDGSFVSYVSTCNVAEGHWWELSLPDRTVRLLDFTEGMRSDRTPDAVSDDGGVAAYRASVGWGDQELQYRERRTDPVTSRWLPDSCDAEYRPPAIDADGSHLAYGGAESIESCQVEFFSVRGEGQIILRELSTGARLVVTRTPAGAAPDGASRTPSMSGDARRIAYTTSATDLVTGDSNGVDDIVLTELG
jgi:hypothetical protein